MSAVVLVAVVPRLGAGLGDDFELATTEQDPAVVADVGILSARASCRTRVGDAATQPARGNLYLRQSKVLTPEGGVRESGDVAKLTGLLDLSGWPEGMRVILRRERPHPTGGSSDVRRLRWGSAPGSRLPPTSAPNAGEQRQPTPVWLGTPADSRKAYAAD
jgi:hypothetical protein